MDQVDSSTSIDQLQALERFVVENDDLLALEGRIGRFNIFDALGVSRAEIRHSNFLAWLLDPAESHGQGGLFLKAILMDLLRQAPSKLRPLSPVELDGEDLRGVELRREWRHIDLLIVCREPAFVIAVENKVDSGEHSDQLSRYQKILRERFPGWAHQLVYLSTEGKDASGDGWVPYSYADIYRVLSRIRRANANAIGDDVLAFLNHYLTLIGSRFMDDPKIDELCQRIFKNHRQALELIYERVGSSTARIVSQLEEIVEKKSDLYLFRKTPSYVEFIPLSWFNLLPEVGKSEPDSRIWIKFYFEIYGSQCRFKCLVCPTTDANLRKAVIDRLIRDRSEFGLSIPRSEATPKWTQLLSIQLSKWKEQDGPDEEKILAVAERELPECMNRLAGVPDALRPIIDEWRAEQN